MEYISLVDSTNALILLPGAEAKRSRVADGWLEVAFIGLQVVILFPALFLNSFVTLLSHQSGVVTIHNHPPFLLCLLIVEIVQWYVEERI